MTGLKKVAWFAISGSRKRDCLVPIGYEDLGFRERGRVGDVEQEVLSEGWDTRGADQVDWDDRRRERK